MFYARCAIISLFSLCAGTSPQNVSTDIKKFTDILVKESVRLCRTADICETSNSDAAQAKQQNIVSCCQDCSCDEDCGERGDCCFPTIDDKASVLNDRKYQDCIAPLTAKLLPTEYYKHKFYYMTTTCPTGNLKVVSHNESRDDCGSIRVAPWGSLLPVYSKSTGKIYKNSACADCHGVLDGISWAAVMDCRNTDSSNTRSITVSENFERLSQNSLPGNCEVRFKISQPIEKERCFRNIIDTCNDTRVVVPEWSEMTEDEIVSACHSGIAAIFQNYFAYANVFCFLCNGGETEATEYCYAPDFESLSNLGPFICLLDTNTLKSATESDTNAETQRPFACMTHDIQQQEESCVSLLCPSGQVFNNEFQCVHLASKWNIPFYHVALRLTFVSARISTSTLTTLLQSGSDVSEWINSPWPSWWSVNSLYCETGNGTVASSYLKSFIMILKMSPSGRNHVQVLNEIRRLMKKRWILKTPQKNISLYADFLEYSEIAMLFHPSIQPQAVPLWYVMALKKQHIQNVPYFRENSILTIIQRKKYLQPSGRINKMNYCMQISLGTNYSKFDILAANKLLFFNGTFYFDGEFELINTENGAIEPRICLEDSQYRRRSFARSSSPQISSYVLTYIAAVLLSKGVHFLALFCPAADAERWYHLGTIK